MSAADLVPGADGAHSAVGVSASPTSLGELVARLEDRYFVGREAEIAAFRRWLQSSTPLPEVLNVIGPSGVGKTTLLRTFRRIGRDSGRAVVQVDGRTVGPTAARLWAALAGAGVSTEPAQPAAALAQLNRRRPLLLLDSFEAFGDVIACIRDEVLPRLDAGTSVVIAGRTPLELSWPRADRWRRILRPLTLAAFSAAEARDYLQRRGLSHTALMHQVMEAAGGNPLALSMAADLVLRREVRDLAAAPEWHLVVRWLVERLLGDVKDTALRPLLEACAIVWQFDEPVLAALSGEAASADLFDRLCRLSVVRPAEHGLMLHDDLRRLLTDDLRWRQPERYETLRASARAHIQERMRGTPAQRQGWLVVERLALWQEPAVQSAMFAGDPGQVWLDAPAPIDRDELCRLREQALAARGVTGDALLPARDGTPAAKDRRRFEALLRHPAVRLRVARDRRSRVIGYSVVLRLGRDSASLLEDTPALARLADAASPAAAGDAALPDSWRDSRTYCVVELVPQAPPASNPAAQEDDAGVRAALLRDLLGLTAQAGVYLWATSEPDLKALLACLRFRRLTAGRSRPSGGWVVVDAVHGYVLDLTQIGVEAWLDAVTGGRPLPQGQDPADLARTLRAAWRRWHDAAWLARSALARLPVLPAVPAPETEAQVAAQVREAVTKALAQARDEAALEAALAFQALEAAYLHRVTSHEQAARRLAVSRATFYRLVDQATRSLAEVLSRRIG